MKDIHLLEFIESHPKVFQVSDTKEYVTLVQALPPSRQVISLLASTPALLRSLAWLLAILSVPLMDRNNSLARLFIVTLYVLN